MWLKKRSSLILNSLIKLYIDTHKPVSSDQLAPLVLLSGSAVRKELQQLEAHGFIYKTAASAGRIPTNRGIKFYLRQLMENLETEKDVSTLPVIELQDMDFHRISDDFLSLLSDKTHNIGFVFLNSIFDLHFKRVRFIKIGPHRVITVIQSLNNCTFSKIFTTTENYSETDLRKWDHILNKEFRGRTLNNTFKQIRNRLFRQKEKFRKIYKELYHLLSNEDLMTAELFFKGTLNILDSDLINPYQVKKVVQTLEEKVKLSKFLNDILGNNKRNLNVIFGTETGISELEDFVLIFSSFYYSKNPIGKLGVIGPKFMPYPYALSKVEHYSSYFSQILSKKPMEV
jgi:heat-inducible transcriptional repressor